MVEFVNDNIIIKIRFNYIGKFFGIEALNGNKKMIKLFRNIRTDKKVTEICVLQCSPVGVETLFQYFLSVSHKQQSRIFTAVSPTEISVIESRNEGLSGSGGSD